MMHRATLLGCGMYAPERVMTNDEIATMVDTSDAWIVEGQPPRPVPQPGPEKTPWPRPPRCSA